jgi:hypothetical protein
MFEKIFSKYLGQAWSGLLYMSITFCTVFFWSPKARTLAIFRALGRFFFGLETR